MELLLNALWLVFSAGTLVSWLCRGRAARDGQSLRNGLLVLGCALVLLFPVISMTDDLYAQQMAVGDSSATSKKPLKSADKGKASLHFHHALGVLVSFSAYPAWQAIGLLPGPSRPAVESLAVTHRSGRAPPFNS